MVAERQLRAKGISPSSLSKQQLKDEIEKWIEEISPRIYQQMESFGLICDMEVPRSMADPKYDRIMSEFFCELYERGVAYEKTAVTDWSPGSRSTIAKTDQVAGEAEFTEYTIKYRLEGEPNIWIGVNTRYPETIHADAALVARPDQSDSAPLLGRTFLSPFGQRIPLIACLEDTLEEQEIRRVSPGHSRFGFHFAKKHDFPLQRAFDEENKMTGGPFEGSSREEARDFALARLEEQGDILAKVSKTERQMFCRKSGTPVEPFLTRQWYLDLGKMLEPTLALMKSDLFNIYPKHLEDILQFWMEELMTAREQRPDDPICEDWCISRQIQCGNTMPVYRDPNGTSIVSLDPPDPREYGTSLKQIEDVFDMQLSCTLWAFCTNRTYTDDRDLLAKIADNAVCVTGMDLLHFWVLSIGMLSTSLSDPLPCRHVLVHPVVCDEEGRKMSKSLGNVVIPTEVLDMYGLDCFRLTLLDGLDLDNETLKFSNEKLQKNQFLIQQLHAAYQQFLMAPDIGEPPRDITHLALEYETLKVAFQRYEVDRFYPTIRQIIDKVISISQEEPAQLAPIASESLSLIHAFLPVITNTIWESAYPGHGNIGAPIS